MRDCRLAHRRFESASYARGEVDEGMSRPLHQSSKPLIRTLCGLRVARSSCAAVRRPHDGAIVCFGGWNGRSSLRSVEHLDCSSEVKGRVYRHSIQRFECSPLCDLPLSRLGHVRVFLPSRVSHFYALNICIQVISEWRWRRGMPDMKVAR